MKQSKTLLIYKKRDSGKYIFFSLFLLFFSSFIPTLQYFSEIITVNSSVYILPDLFFFFFLNTHRSINIHIESGLFLKSGICFLSIYHDSTYRLTFFFFLSLMAAYYCSSLVSSYAVTNSPRYVFLGNCIFL